MFSDVLVLKKDSFVFLTFKCNLSCILQVTVHWGIGHNQVSPHCLLLAQQSVGHSMSRCPAQAMSWLPEPNVTDVLWVFLPSLNLFTFSETLMLHASTEQPYPSTQHESGVQPRYQPWEQPRYKPCSGLSSTRWVHVGAGPRSRAFFSCSKCLSETAGCNDLLVPSAVLWPFLLSVLFLSYPLWSLSACSSFGSFQFHSSRKQAPLAVLLFPTSCYQANPVGLAGPSVRQSRRKATAT